MLSKGMNKLRQVINYIPENWGCYGISDVAYATAVTHPLRQALRQATQSWKFTFLHTCEYP